MFVKQLKDEEYFEDNIDTIAKLFNDRVNLFPDCIILSKTVDGTIDGEITFKQAQEKAIDFAKGL
jgi:hypothetical protein